MPHPGETLTHRVPPVPLITAHLNAGYDSSKPTTLLTGLGSDWVIGTKGEPLQAGTRLVVERINARNTSGSTRLLVCTAHRRRVFDTMITLTSGLVMLRNLIRAPRHTRRRDPGPNASSNGQSLRAVFQDADRKGILSPNSR